jgi:hypothetical protein
MRKPCPFKVPVDLDRPDVHSRVMVDMPMALNLNVHLSNEHKIARGESTELAVSQHLMAHLHGEFREGSEHYHVEGEYA